METVTWTCPVRGCNAEMRVAKIRTQHGTGVRRPDIHRAFVLEKVGRIMRAGRGRWGWYGGFDV